MARAMQVIVGLIGILSLLTAIPHWFALDRVAALRGLSGTGIVGMANLRADVGGIFIAIGVFALLAAARQNRHWATATLILVASALAGRFVSIAIDGINGDAATLAAVELLTISALAMAIRSWGKVPEGL